jgi:glycosyltransferase involved in cell wall biosynthesis
MFDFTVLMSVYSKDKPDLFNRALKSVFSNSLSPSDVLLICDGPLGSELELIITSFSFNYPSVFRVIRLPSNLGLCHALNIGLKNIDSEWIIRADADDFNHQTRFQEIAKAVNENPDVVIVGSSVEEIERDGRLVGVRMPPITHHEILDFVKRRNPFNHMTVAFRASFVKSVGGYPDVYLREDYALWSICLSKGAIGLNIRKALVTANAGMEMYYRRGGLRYALGEFRMQRVLVECGFKTVIAALIDGALRGVVFLLPAHIRGLIYVHILRSPSL